MSGATIRRVALLLLLAAGARAHDGGGVCAGNAAPVAAARAALDETPEALTKRFALADALIVANCYEEAVLALERGEALHPRNLELQTRLRNVRSLMSEQSYFAGLEEAEVAARVSRNLLRCSRLGDLNACDEALKLRPGDPQVIVATGEAQLKANRPADAEVTLLRGKRVAPGDPRVAARLVEAQGQRQTALGVCQRGAGDQALAACQAALMRGAPDEFSVHSRLAQLYQQRNQPAAALASYVAADALHKGDRNVALGIVAVTDADQRKDAVTLVARGSALLTLRRGREALSTLRQAQNVAPTMPDLHALISKAEAVARSQTASDARAPVPVRVADAEGATAAPARRYSNSAEPTRSH
jgi:tetratricopeptide (TPR) repeat protein